MEIKVSDIKVENRSRRDLGDFLGDDDEESLVSLSNSIKKFGLLQPLVVSSDFTLLCGERRLRATKLAGLDTVSVVIKDITDPIITKQIELEENLRRKGLNWSEKVDAVNTLHNLKQETLGKKSAGASSYGWSSYDTAQELGIAQSSVHLAKELALALELIPELINCKTQDEAYKKWKAVKKQVIREDISKKHREDIASGKVIEHQIYLGNCLDIMKNFVEPGTVDIIATDPPYGVNIESVKKVEVAMPIYPTFSDSPLDYKELIEKFFDVAIRVTKSDALFFVCLGWQYYEFVKNLMVKRGLIVDPSPLIWIKPQGQTHHPELYFARSYELILFGIKGERRIVKQGLPNWFQVSPVSPQYKEHPLEKPVDFWVSILDRVVEPGDLVLDPFAGTGSCLIAAEQLNCKVIGIEEDPYYHSILVDRVKSSKKG